MKLLILSLASLASSAIPSSVSAVVSNPNAVNIPNSSGTSRNWSGYAATNGTFTSVAGNWKIPSVTEDGHTSVDAMWVGIGGVKSSDLIQAGTQNTIDPSGNVTTTAFYEMLPDVSQTIPVSVKTGDTVSVSITQAATNQWQISFSNVSTGQIKQIPLTYASSLSSAEWIEEAPSNGYRTLPLDNFGSISLSGGSTMQNNTSQSLTGSGAQAITMVNSTGQVLATPSGLGEDGASFIVTRSSASSGQAISQYDNNPGGFRRRGFGIGGFTPRVRRQVYVIPPSFAPAIPSDNDTSTPAVSQAPIQKYQHQGSFRVRRFFFRTRRFDQY